MTRTHIKLSLLALLTTGLISCATGTGIHNNSPNFSEATAHNRAVQAVEPTAEQKNNTYIPADANRQSIARDNYRENNVPEPSRISTR